MNTPITSCPCSNSKWAATLESTPPDIANTTRAIRQVYGCELSGAMPTGPRGHVPGRRTHGHPPSSQVVLHRIIPHSAVLNPEPRTLSLSEVPPMLENQWYDRAKAIRQTVTQLRDSL